MAFDPFTLFLVAVSSLLQYSQAKKARRKAKEEAEARKGFDIVVDGEIRALPLVYGRAKIGGVRVFHDVKSDHINAASNADKSFTTGDVSSKSSSKNTYLYFQQALCKREISAVYDLIIDDSRRIDDTSLSKDDAALRVDVHYGASGESCDFMSANIRSRSTSLFTGAAFMSVMVRLERDDPQFSGVPDIAVLIEGCPVRDVVGGVLQEYAYSNNPALVLLDYLLNEKGIPAAYVDLESFEAAARICETQVRSDVPVGGYIWQPVDGSRNITSRSLPLYEANIVLDTEVSFRDNVELILQTMGDARLTRPQGIFRLVLQYPASNDEIVVADYIDDDRIVDSENISIVWPTAEERLNNATIHFNNESSNFKEDTINWPPKPYGQYYRGVGGVFYEPRSGWDNTESGRFMDRHAVWYGSTGAKTFVWRIRPLKTGTYTLNAAADDNGQLSINAIFVSSLTGPEEYNEFAGSVRITSLNSVTVDLISGVVYVIDGSAYSSDIDFMGLAGNLIDPDGVEIWSTRDASYTAIEEVNTDNTLYNTFLAEDNSVKLEADFTIKGVTEYYHALAKAEELVRTSRSATQVSFSYRMGNGFPEPGDVIRIASSQLKLGNENAFYLKLNEISMGEDRIIKVEGTRFDYTQLAWNVADDMYLMPERSFDLVLQPPTYILYHPGGSTIQNAAGYITWPAVTDAIISDYLVYIEISDVWTYLGVTSDITFNLPDLVSSYARFGVISRSKSGILSAMRISPFFDMSREVPPTPTNGTAIVYGDHNESAYINWTIPEYANHSLSLIYRSTESDFETAIQVGEVSLGSTYIDAPTIYGTLYYWVVLLSRSGIPSEALYCGSVEVNFWDFFLPDDEIATPQGVELSTASEIGNDGTEVITLTAEWLFSTSPFFRFYEVTLTNTTTSWSTTVVTSVNSYTFNVAANTEYSVTVVAVDSAGLKSAPSVAVLLTSASDNTPPETVTGLTLTPGFKLIGLSFDKSAARDIKGYVVERSDDVGFSIPVEIGTIFANYVVDSGLETDATYYYRVKGVDTSGNISAAWSAIESATTLLTGSSDIAANSIIASHMSSEEIYTIAIESANYVAGTTGFKINSLNNTAEFNNYSITISYTDVNGAPSSLEGINSSEYNHLTGIAAGATVGATWGVNIGGTNLPADNADVTDYIAIGLDAQARADAAQAAAEAASDAYGSASAAYASAQIYADAAEAAATVTAAAYADGIVTAEEARAILDATTKANTAQANAIAYVDANFITQVVYGSGIADLQNQIDGNITTWFYDIAPTLINVPASTWTTNTIKDAHLGDLYYDNVTGYGYRFRVVAGVYSWLQITDTDITTALANAATAQDTADSKRRVFTATPTAPYDIGDLWDAPTGLRRCVTSLVSGAFVDGHWSAAIADVTSENTSLDTVAVGGVSAATVLSNITQAINDASDAQATADGKVTTFYQASAPTAEGVGDLWVDTDAGNKLYRWSGSSWVAVQDTAIQTAMSNASTAQSTADGKIVSYHQTTAPAGGATGDIWFDTDDNNKPYWWTGSVWQNVENPTSWANVGDPSGTKPANNADVTQAAVDATVDTTTGGFIVRNSGSGDYALLSAADLTFYYSTDEGYKEYKSVRRIETGFANSGDSTIIPGVFRNAPTITIAPFNMPTFVLAHNDVDQALRCLIESGPTSEGSGVYSFVPRIEVLLGESYKTATPNDTFESTPYNLTNLDSSEYICDSSTKIIKVNGWSTGYKVISNSIYLGIRTAYLQVKYSSGDTWHTVDSMLCTLRSPVPIPFYSLEHTDTSVIYSFRIHTEYHHAEDSGSDTGLTYDYVKLVIMLWETWQDASSVIAEGSVSWIAVGD